MVAAATTQLAGYVTTRTAEMRQRYVGILTDGRLWIAFHEVNGDLVEATRHTAVAGTGGAKPLLRWLEGVLATKRAVPPTPLEIVDRLGANSSSHALDRATLSALYADSRELPTVKLKRDLWADLLRSALGTQFPDTDELFLEHTLLVNSAEIIAHLVLGLNVEQLSSATLLSGDQFTIAGLHGVVDRDFFDWVLEVPGGDGFVTALARRLARFDWSQVEHDVLKVLYESVISTETRKALGEYYTPDWLANRIVSEVVTDPLNQRVLDPSCGSGTFVFYAVKRFLEAADDAGMSLKDAMMLVPSRVMGIDLHPVAVALARVTYLLALGRERLNSPNRGTLSVPIYLGDSLGWDQHRDLFSVDDLVIPTEVGDQLFSTELRFADRLLADSSTFDALVEALVSEAGRAAGRTTSKLSDGTIRRLAISQRDVPALNANFVRLKQLHEADRDHVWSYYIRNVSRPAWLAREENRVDVLVGNPPWLSYRHMTTAMQKRFKELCQERGFWRNEATATHQDLAGVFVARAVERYLKKGGRLAFVVPNPVIDRDYWSGFRTGDFQGAAVTFTTSWDLRRIRPHLFPRGSAVIFGTNCAQATTMPRLALVWVGRAPHRHATIDAADHLRQILAELTFAGGEDGDRSPYATRFSQGANLVPRMMFRVESGPVSGLGVPSGRINVQSKRSVGEKAPWKHLPSMAGMVETEFVWPTILGEHVIPFRVLTPDKFVIPLTQRGEILGGEDPDIDRYPGLATWVRTAETLWSERGASNLTLTGQIDHMSKLRQQVPVARLRVVYAASGMHVAAALVTDPRVIFEHAVYWAAVASESEGHYLVGILNSPSLTELVRPLMSYGKDERHVDKHVWKLPIPTYDPSNEVHTEISQLARQLTAEIADQNFRSDYFVTIRRDIRTFLAEYPLGRRLDELVVELLDIDSSATVAPVEAPELDSVSLIRTTSGSLPLSKYDIEVDVDCEFDESRRVYLWGALVTDAANPDGIYRSFADPSIGADEQESAKNFETWLTEILAHANNTQQTVRWFHYGATETRELHRVLGERAEPLLAHATDLLTEIIRPHFYSPAGYGLKPLATSAGATWRTPGTTGADTYAWIAATRAGDGGAWTRLLEYNEDDTRATYRLRRSLTEDHHDAGS